jgi:hypothetical protein
LHSPTHFTLVASLCLAALALGPEPTFAQDSTPAEAKEPQVSASLLRRLAEVADAYRTGRPVFIVASTKAPHDIKDVYEDAGAATKAAAAAGPSYQRFGPYITPRDRFKGKPAEVLAITVKLRTGSDTVSVTVDPRKYDALVWTLPALDKFLVPYYARIYGLDRARELREEYLRNASTSPLDGHMLKTFTTIIVPVP